MRCLLVGAGAVGQVFGNHLSRGGAEVGFLVKPKHEAETRRGLVLYPQNRPRRERTAPVTFRDYQVLTSAAAAGDTWDYVLLCVSSTALRSGRWLEEVAGAAAGARVVCLQPGIEDVAYVEARVAPARVVVGAIGFLSYPAPMPGEKLPEPGVAYWFPPLGRTPLSGAPEAVRPLVSLLRRGGFPAAAHPEVQRLTAFGSAYLQSQMAALECAGWRFGSLHRDPELQRTALRAFRQALAVSSAERGVREPRSAALLRPGLVRLSWRLARAAAPFDLERFFEIHFTKVRDQTALLLEMLAERGRERGLATDAIEDLLRRLEAVTRPVDVEPNERPG